MRLGKFLEAVSHQLSASSVFFLANAGFLDVNSVSYYNDYKAIHGSHSELTACEPGVFVNFKECVDHSSNVFIIANKNNKCFVCAVVYSRRKGIESIPLQKAHYGLIDLSDDGERWEGDIVDGYPCGWGRLFNSDNVLCYEGFRFKKYHVCYGTSYYTDVFPETMEYAGMISFGLRCGMGTEYNRSGVVVYTGLWMSNVQLSENTVIVPPNTTELLHNTLMNGFVIQEHCYPHIRVFSLHSYPFLETVDIAPYCFYNEDTVPSFTQSPFTISSCDMLHEISIDGCSFSHFTSFTLFSLPMLRSIRIADTQPAAFPVCHIFSLESLPALERVNIGINCFQKARSVVFRSMDASFLPA